MLIFDIMYMFLSKKGRSFDFHCNYVGKKSWEFFLRKEKWSKIQYFFVETFENGVFVVE